MIKLTLTPRAANFLWEIIELALRSKQIGEPDAMEDLLEVRGRIAASPEHRAIRKKIEAAAAARKEASPDA
jgi:hypothetical protein